MNIGFFKLGRSVLFDKSKWSTIGGDIEAPILISTIAKLNPKDNFYLIGKNDLERAKKKGIDIPSNIISLVEGPDDENDLLERLEKIKLDFFFFYSGPHGTKSNIYDYIYTEDLTRYYKPMQMFTKYSGVPIHALNRLSYHIPSVGLLVDNRFKVKAKDWAFYNRPQLYLAQNTFQDEELYFTNPPYLETEARTIRAVYSKIETVFLLGRQKPNNITKNREGFNLVLNQGKGSGGLDRYPIIKDFIIDNEIGCDIYGKWDDDVMESDERFKGPIWIEKLEPLLHKTKFTFIVPVVKDIATAKFWEMIHYGIVPFLHPFYDSEGNVIPKDHFLRVKSPNDLKEKIKIIEKDDKLYNQIFNELQDMLTEDLYNGMYLNKKIFKAYELMRRKK